MTHVLSSGPFQFDKNHTESIEADISFKVGALYGDKALYPSGRIGLLNDVCNVLEIYLL